MGQHVTLALMRPRSEQPGRYVTLRLGPPAVPVVVLPETLPTALVGAPYAHSVTATGGTGPYTFTVSSGSLPPGVTLASGGAFSGTPTTAGSATFAVTATDALSATGTRSYTIAITDPTWRGLQSSIGLPWTRRHARQRTIASGWDESTPLTAAVRAPWSAGVARSREIRLDWSPTVPQTAALSARWGTRAPLTRQVSARWDDLLALSAQLGVPWATPAPLSRPLLIPWAAPPPAQRSWGAPWAAPLPQVRSWGTPWLNPPHKQRELMLPWGAGQPPPWVIVHTEDTPPPPPPPSRSGRHVTLRLSCPRRTGPSNHITLPLGPWQCYIGRRQPRVFIVDNTVTIVRVPDNAPIAVHDISIRGDLDSAVWACSASVSDDASLALLQPGPSGDPRRFRVVVNGWAWEFLAEADQEGATFGGKERTVTGRSATAVLSGEYASRRTVTQASARDASQLAAEVLTDTGITLDWQAVDWLVPGGVWSYSDLAPLDALREIASACGAVVQSHRTADTVRVIPIYATRPWQWAVTAPDVEIVDDYLKARRGGSARGIRHNTVEVRGEVTGGIRGICTITGTAGDLALPQVTHRLITAAAAAEARGIYELARVGPIGETSIELPLFAAPTAPGLVSPGTLVRVSGSYRALATAVQIRATWLPQGGCTVNQTVTMERHFDA